MEQQAKVSIFGLLKERMLTFIVLILFATIVPVFVHQQWFTGPFVNALLFLVCVLVGPMEAVILGLLPSTVALNSGLLPLPLAPMIPFIMIANAILVAVFYYIHKKNYVWAIVLAAFLKFLFLWHVSTFLAQNLLPETLLSKVTLMMSWPQFVTALIGGVFAYVVLKFLKKV